MLTEYTADGRKDSFLRDYLIKANYDSSGVVLVENGNGYAKIYGNDFKTIIEEGNVKGGKREGVWKGYNEHPTLSFKEEYQNGQLISGTSISADGKTATYTKSRGSIPEFKGGIAAFSQYLSNNIRYPDYERANNIQGRVILSFVLKEDSKITDIKVKKSVSPGLDQEAVRVLNASPRWVPATMFGAPVRVLFSVPISFSLN